MRWLALVVVAGCWRGASTERVLSQSAPADELVMTEAGVGPFDASTVATLRALRRSVPMYTVQPRDLGADAGVVYNVFRDRERLIYVVPDDAPGWTDDSGVEHQYAQTTFAVFAVHRSVRVEGRSWRVGQPLADPSHLDRCDCWGDHEVTACYAQNSHIRVIFEQGCEDDLPPSVMVGKRIARLMWKRDAEVILLE